MMETQEAMRISDLESFKSMFHTLSPFSNPNFDSLFPQLVLPSDVSLPAPPGSSYSVLPHPTVDQIDQDPDSNNSNTESETVVQSLRCEICRVDCNSKSVLETHLTGKKHKKNLQNLGDSSAAGNSMTNEPRLIQSIRCQDCDVDCNSKDMYEKHLLGKKHKKKVKTHIEQKNTASHVPQVDCSKALEEKEAKVLRNSLPANSVKVCTICNIVCNSQETFDKHLAGKKHVAQVKTHIEQKNTASQVPRVDCSKALEEKEAKVLRNSLPANSVKVCTICNIGCNSQDMFDKHLAGKKHVAQVRLKSQIREQLSVKRSVISTARSCLISIPNENASSCLESTAMGAKPVQFAYCDICKIYFNSSDILSGHKLGALHLENLEKFAIPGTENTNSSGLVVKPLADLEDIEMENVEANQVNSIDLKRKNTDQPGLVVEMLTQES